MLSEPALSSLEGHSTLEEASKILLPFALQPEHWLLMGAAKERAGGRRPVELEYTRRVGTLRVVACVDVTSDLGVLLRVAFRGPNLSPTQAADYLEAFLRPHSLLIPNAEWSVEVDGQRWIHFWRRYLGSPLMA